MKSKKIYVGDVPIGGGSPISIQSMTNTQTKDIESTIGQILELENSGCEIIRAAVNDEEDANSFSKIKKHINIPLIADIQFDYKLAIYAAKNKADCIRVNPGNIGNKDKVREIVRACEYYGIPIRIGVNSGSIAKNVLKKYNGVNEKSLLESALMEIEVLESLNFYNTKVAIKSTLVKDTIGANKIFRQICDYPLHIGITESGTKEYGSIKSSVGIGALLSQNIGDTIRVSLTSKPVDEIITAKRILQSLGIRNFDAEVISCPTCSRTSIDMFKLAKEVEERALSKINKPIKIAVMGCPVNGPGEAKEADYGISGAKGKGVIFKKGKILKTVKQEDLLNELFQIIESDNING
ncbi:MAG: flavodoxin-dependent (E)-4-hydroxy-3-methylbut-2-enyl-diphosphate synthase [Tissierellia bacterium]|nr:flavodoxin-dependent (E)-4-hydroxy-3-methylbut-2-enyl-diphosphate synthase [Tissierellia bacterium]